MAYNYQNFDPAKMIDEFDRISGKVDGKLDKRGQPIYENDYFGPKNLAAYNEAAKNHIGDESVKMLAKTEADNFLNTARDPNARGHLEARNRYHNEFKGDPNSVHKHHLIVNRAKHKLKGFDDGMPSRNKAREARILTPPQTRKITRDDVVNAATLKNLMEARFHAIGYGENHGYPTAETMAADFWANYCKVPA